jgi:hypothetical protein
MENTTANKRYLLDVIFRASVIIDNLRKAKYERALVDLEELGMCLHGTVITYHGSVLPAYSHVDVAMAKVKSSQISKAIECMLCLIFDVSRCDASR